MATVGVFGTWRALPGSEIYDQAEEIGRISGEAGYSVLTGGYSGVMEAAPRGAKSVAGQTLGYTWVGLDGDLEPNGFLDETRHFDSVVERLACLIEDSDICVFFPGRTGTVAELALATEARAKGALTSPLVLVGCYWKSFFNWLEKSNQKLGLPTGDEDEACIYRVIEKPVHFEAFLGDRR
ncbi:MAG: LOG family protein [Anaerolineae bacterium]|nr:LOG family protein [Anaerolineae bacterium]